MDYRIQYLNNIIDLANSKLKNERNEIKRKVYKSTIDVAYKLIDKVNLENRIYKNDTDKINTYVLGSKGKSFISRLIRKYQRGFPYTHIAYAIDISEKNNPIVIEAWHIPYKPYYKPPFLKGGGIYLYNFSVLHTPETEFTIFCIQLTKRQKRSLETFLLDKVYRSLKGQIHYDFKGILGFATYSDYQNEQNYFCSELVFDAYKRGAEINLLNFIPPYEVSPRIFLLTPYLKEVYTTKLIVNE